MSAALETCDIERTKQYNQIWAGYEQNIAFKKEIQCIKSGNNPCMHLRCIHTFETIFEQMTFSE